MIKNIVKLLTLFVYRVGKRPSVGVWLSVFLRGVVLHLFHSSHHTSCTLKIVR